mmetsp:Transcript_49930/g.53904  ORF Transcript_49930/g.53904 Transcript_49930/m.53904 type:complete len:324 (+) Transcript_49930:73-1044(+)
MEDKLDSLFCCWGDAHSVDDQEFSSGSKHQQNFRHGRSKKHRRGRSPTVRSNTNASFDGTGNRTLDSYTDSFNSLAEQQQGLEIEIYDTDGIKTKKRKDDSIDQRKRRAPRLMKPTELETVRSHDSCHSTIKTCWQVVDNEDERQSTSKNDSIEIRDSLLTSSSADKQLNPPGGSTIEIYCLGNSEKEKERKTELVIRKESIEICDSPSLSVSAPTSASVLSPSPSSSWNEKCREKRRSKRHNIMKKIRNMQANKCTRSRTDTSSTLSSTVSTDTNIDSVFTTREEEYPTLESYILVRKNRFKIWPEPSHKSFGFISRMNGLG